MAYRHQVRNEDIKPRIMKTNRPRSKRQLGCTNSIRWISPAGWQRTDTNQPSSQSSSTQETTRPHFTDSRPPSGKYRPSSSHSRPPSSHSRPPSSHSRPVSSSQKTNKSQYSRQISEQSNLQRPSSSHSLYSSSVSGLSKLSNPIKLAPRPQSSLGFQNKWSVRPATTTDALAPPQGFDVASYIKQNKSTKGIIIGKNGQPSTDVYFDAYLEQCEDGLLEQAESDSVIELDSINGEEELSSNRGLKSEQVPLCWEDQLSQSEAQPGSLRCSSQKTLKNSRQAAVKERQQLIIDSTKVKLILDKQCLLDTTPLGRLQTSPLCDTHAADSSTQVDYKTTVEITTLSPAHSRPTQGQPGHTLEILLYSRSELVQLELEKQTYNVIISSIKSDIDCSASESPLSKTVCNNVFSNLIARRVLRCVSAIQVNVEDQNKVFQTEPATASNNLNSVTVLCGQPRWLLFTAALEQTVDSSEPVNSQTSQFIEQLQSQLEIAREKTKATSRESLSEVPDKFFYKRTSYFSQEEDEDRTDLALISSYIPDLKLIEDENKLTGTLPTNSTNSSIYREAFEKSIPHRQAKSPTLATFITRSTNSPELAPKALAIPSGKKRKKYRPHPHVYIHGTNFADNDQPRDVEDEKKSTQIGHKEYSKIATSWLKQYF